IRHLKTSHWERERHQDRAARTKAVLAAARLPVMTSPTHIVPVYVGDPELCKAASDLLLADHGLYLHPINYPTVPKGTERLRITPAPYHEDALIDALAEALVDVWQKLGLPFKARALHLPTRRSRFALGRQPCRSCHRFPASCRRGSFRRLL